MTVNPAAAAMRDCRRSKLQNSVAPNSKAKATCRVYVLVPGVRFEHFEWYPFGFISQAESRFRPSAADLIPTRKGIESEGGFGGESEDFPFVGLSVEGGEFDGAVVA